MPNCRDRTATAERTEYADEKTEDKTQYPAENRDNSYMVANQHMVKFADELRNVNEQGALGFDRRKNPAEYELKEKQEMLETSSPGWARASSEQTPRSGNRCSTSWWYTAI